jgi:NitT/TauT family transport system ATP-binding protein
MSSSTPFVLAEGISHRFTDGVPVIRDVSLTIPAGAFVALVGPSGVGKSTLLRIMAGLLQPAEGRVLLDGVPPNQTDHAIGIVFQRYNLMPWRTVHDNVRLPLELQGINGKEAAGRVSDLIRLVGLSGFENSYPSQLSGGMAQRVAIARALIHRPRLLLLDEPFGALDALTRERMAQELLRIWQAMPVTVCMVTHSIPEAVMLADEVVVMTGCPGQLTGQVSVGLARPRLPEMQMSESFFGYTTAVRSAIEAHSEIY